MIYNFLKYALLAGFRVTLAVDLVDKANLSTHWSQGWCPWRQGWVFLSLQALSDQLSTQAKFSRTKRKLYTTIAWILLYGETQRAKSDMKWFRGKHVSKTRFWEAEKPWEPN